MKPLPTSEWQGFYFDTKPYCFDLFNVGFILFYLWRKLKYLIRCNFLAANCMIQMCVLTY